MVWYKEHFKVNIFEVEVEGTYSFLVFAGVAVAAAIGIAVVGYRAINSYEKALEICNEDLGIRKKTVAENNEIMKNYKNTIGDRMETVAEHGETLDFYRETYNLQVQSHAMNHKEDALLYKELEKGDVLVVKRDLRKRLKADREFLRGKLSNPGSRDFLTAETRVRLEVILDEVDALHVVKSEK